MSEITSTIKEILNVRPHESEKYGTTWYFKLEMANGDVGSIGKKKQDALKVGDSLTYTIEQTENGNKFKPVQTNNGFGGGGKYQPPKDASFALSYSKDLMVALITSDQLPDDKRNAQDIVKGTLYIATEFNKWLKENN